MQKCYARMHTLLQRYLSLNATQKRRRISRCDILCSILCTFQLLFQLKRQLSQSQLLQQSPVTYRIPPFSSNPFRFSMYSEGITVPPARAKSPTILFRKSTILGSTHNYIINKLCVIYGTLSGKVRTNYVHIFFI